MAYCTLADIKDQIDERKLIQLTDDEGLGVVGEARVTKAIADADEQIDGHIGHRHMVPMEPAPAILRKYSVDIAIYNLYARRETVPDVRADRYKDAVRFLEMVALGKISLGSLDPEGNPPASDAPEMSVDNPERAFTRGSMEGF